uniref:CFEM domain-containing protein n=1 Tax=Steinernema glaseri TaxID=37863 RepID=A0A1I8AIA4_9BILA
MIIATMECTEKALANSCAAAPGRMVTKRYPETLKIATLAEINKMLGRSGIAGQTKNMLATGKKFAGCVKNCMEKRSGNCANKLGCGLDLPSDNQLVQIAKQCAMKSGFNTAAVQSVCNCAANAGVVGLRGVCNKIVIS